MGGAGPPRSRSWSRPGGGRGRGTGGCPAGGHSEYRFIGREQPDRGLQTYRSNAPGGMEPAAAASSSSSSATDV